MKTVIILKIFLFLVVANAFADRPCLPRGTNYSVLCVCNDDYCDTISRTVPKPGYYVTYTSSRGGQRFNKNSGIIEPTNVVDENGDNNFEQILQLDVNKKYQVIEGFGGAVTDSAGEVWKSLSPALQQYLIESYFSEDGIEYNLLRVPNGSTDFSRRAWTYNEFPVNDTKLTNFTLSPEDVKYKIPMIQASLNAATDEVKVISSTWRAPDWMLSESRTGIKYLKEQFYEAFALYNCRFAELYQSQGIKISAMSAVNEPLIPILAEVKNESMLWAAPHMGKFIAKHFGPIMRKCSVEGIKILGVEDQRFTIPLYFNQLKKQSPEAIDFIDGIALHYYIDEDTSPAVIPRALRNYPDKFVISTEACVKGGPPSETSGSWDSAKEYIKDILENLNYNLVGWVDWNMCLDTQGGPTFLKNFVSSPITVDAEKQEFYKQPMYYALGQFSKFIPRGSQRIKVSKNGGHSCEANLDLQEVEAMGQELFDNVAFVTPRGTIVVVIHNEGPSQNIAIQWEDRQISLSVEEESITTVEFSHDEESFFA